jgi:GNAT superfamily N-acetyltransferase
MAISVSTPDLLGMPEIIAGLREWQSDVAAFQLHPGDLGWFERFGADAARAAVRVWTRAGHILAIGLLDGAELLRLTVAPDATADPELAEQLVADLTDAARGVFAEGEAFLEVPNGVLVRELLTDNGWQVDEPWTPLSRDLRDPVDSVELSIETVGAELIETRVALQRASFATSTFTVEARRAMAAGVAFADARDLIGFDESGTPVAAITVWSAGPGRPGLVEPMGVHRDHRGRGYGRAITLAGAAALRDMGASSATVCTKSSNRGGIATYRAAGFQPLQERRDLRRDAQAPA